MSPATLSVYVLAVAGITVATNFEDEPRNFGSQLIRRITAVHGLVFVRNRNFQSNTIGHCHAMKKDQRLGMNQFRYLVFTALNPQQNEFAIFATPFTISKTDPHTMENAAAFRTEAECLLMQTAYTVSGPVPSDCHVVYTRSCRGLYFNLSDSTCMNLLRRYRPGGH